MKQVMTITNCEKIDEILQTVKKTMGKKEVLNQGDYDLQIFRGKIGDDVTFLGKCVGNTQPTSIDLMCQKQALGTIITKNGFNKKNIDTLVVSPHWATAKTMTMVTYEKTNKLEVWYTVDETADAVINNIYEAVEQSKAKVQINKKLSQLNLSKSKIQDVEHVL